MTAPGGPVVGGGASAAIAYSPVDNLELVAGTDLGFAEPTRHYAGQVGIGVYAREDVLRLEAIAGVFGGEAHGEAGSLSTGTGEEHSLHARYLAPYAQLFVGWHERRFENAFGVRVTAYLAEVDVVPLRGATPLGASQFGYERVAIEPAYTARALLGDIVRLDTQVGFSFYAGGDTSPTHGAVTPDGTVLDPDPAVGIFFAVGLGVQIDTSDPPPSLRLEPEPEPMVIDPPPGAYVPPS
jgi:hypothetical protein